MKGGRLNLEFWSDVSKTLDQTNQSEGSRKKDSLSGPATKRGGDKGLATKKK